MKKAIIVSVVILAVMSTSTLFAAEVNPGMLCTAIVDRACDGIGSTFPTDVGKVYVHTRILGIESGGSVTHRWIFKDKVMAETKLNIGGSDWRTWSSKNIDPFWSGDWKVDDFAKSHQRAPGGRPNQ